MLKRIALTGVVGLVLALGGCGSSKKDSSTENNAAAAGTGESGSGGSGTAGEPGAGSNASGSADGGTSSSGSNSASGGNSDGGSTTPPSASTDGGTGTTTPPTSSGPASDGSQFAYCTNNQDCGDGLRCFAQAHYCTQACAEDADCSSLGDAFSCVGATAAGGGGFPGGGFMPGGARDGGAAAMPTGTCRASCDGESDTSCPAGMGCMAVAAAGPGGGFGGGFQGGGFPGAGGGQRDAGAAAGGTYRCEYTTDQNPASVTPAYGKCSSNQECMPGLRCTATRGGAGYCTQTCQSAMDCTMQPSSGTVMPTCGAGGTCTLNCAGDGATCPDDMTCNGLGMGAGGSGGAGGGFGGGFGGGGFGGGFGGGAGFAFCNYSAM